MRIAVRADASLDIGSGHIMRCLTLAETLREQGSVCTFVAREHPGHLLDLARNRGFETFALPTALTTANVDPLQPSDPAHASWLGVGYSDDAQQTLAALGEQVFDWVVVDHYALDYRWEQQVQLACRRMLVIDDLADRRHDCDLLLDQNLGREADDYAALVPNRCKVLVGPEYALLRAEFPALRQASLERRRERPGNRLLISLGGVDKHNATGDVLDALKRTALPNECSITVVLGTTAPWAKRLHALAAKMPWPTEIRIGVTDMAQLMYESDFAIGAAGSSAWERCCLGLPTLVIVLAENQRVGALALEAGGSVLLLGGRDCIGRDLPARLLSLLSAEKMQSLQRACAAVTDGCGVTRLAAAMADTN